MNSAKRTVRVTPGFYKVGLTAVMASGGNVTFDLSNLTRVLSDAAKNGKTPMVHAISLAINHSGTYAASGAGNTFNCADIQRLCFYQLNLQIPNLSSQYYLKNPRLAFVRQSGLIINPQSVVIDRLLYQKKRHFNRTDTGNAINSYAGLEVPSPDVDKRVDLLSGWRDDENWQNVSTALAGAFDFNDVVTMPLCTYSGNFSNDRLPLAMLADPSNPWKLTISEVEAGGSDIRTDLFKTTAHTVRVECYVYVSFVDSTSALSVGTIWTVAPNSFESNQTIPSHFYRFIGMFPDYNSATKDTALTLAVPYLPADYQNPLDNLNLRVYDCSEQVFPLDSESECTRTTDHANIGAAVGCNPWFLYKPDGTSTRIAGPGTTIALPHETADWYNASAAGLWSSMPCFPLLINHLAVQGFPINVMDAPGCSAQYRITVDGTTEPAGDVFYIYVGEYPNDRATALSYAAKGMRDSNYNTSSWMPALSNPTSPEAASSSLIVPAVLNR